MKFVEHEELSQAFMPCASMPETPEILAQHSDIVRKNIVMVIMVAMLLLLAMMMMMVVTCAKNDDSQHVGTF